MNVFVFAAAVTVAVVVAVATTTSITTCDRLLVCKLRGVERRQSNLLCFVG